MTIEVPLQIYRDKVRPEWIDYNGHMNVAYYVLAFDYATDAFFDHLGRGVLLCRAKHARRHEQYQ